MANGKIGEERDFFDNLYFMTQLRLIPAPGNNFFNPFKEQFAKII